MSINEHNLAIQAVVAGAEIVRSYCGSSLTQFRNPGVVSPRRPTSRRSRRSSPSWAGHVRATPLWARRAGRMGAGENGRTWLVDPFAEP